MIAFEDLDTDFRKVLEELGQHKKVSIGRGAKAIIVYVVGRQTEKLVESKIPREYRSQVEIVLTGKIRAHGTAPKTTAKHR